MRTGAVFVAYYAREKSLTNATLFLVHLHRHFQEYGISVSGSVIQTDNGTEFTAPWHSRKATVFSSESFGSEKGFLRKAAYYQAQFNCTRHNSYKGNTPLALERKTNPGLPAEALVLIRMILNMLIFQYKDELARWSKVAPEGTMCLQIP